MGHLTQLGLLLKKNFILRKRSPGVLVLELVWPVLIVAIVAVIRQGVPLGVRDTCHYQERAMPSAGVVPFLQTFVCNLDNQCHSTYTLNRAKETTYSVSKLVQQLAPILSSDDVLEGLESMDKGVDMIEALIKLTNDSDILTGLGDMLIVRNFFRDPDYVKQVLVTNFRVMSVEQVDAMLDSTVNITMIFELIGYPDFKSVACNATRLSQFLLFKPSVDVRDISTSICNISIDMIPQITTFLQRQFDIAQLIRIMGHFERVKQRLGKPYTSSMAFNDIADMLDLALKSPTLMAMIKSMSSLEQLPDLIRGLPQIMEKIQKLGYYDLSPLVKLVNMIDPVVEANKPNDTIWYVVKYGVYLAADISDIIQQRTNGSMSEVASRLLHSAQQMGENLQHLLGIMGQDLQLVLGAMAKVDWTSIYDQIFSGTIDTQAAAKSLKELQATLQELPEVWNITAPVVMMTTKFLEMGNIVVQETNGLMTKFVDMVNQVGPVQTAFTNLFNRGPNITLAVLTAFTDSRALAKLFETPFSYQSFCNEILDEVQDMTNTQDVSELRNVMCNNDIATSVNDLIHSLRVPDVQAIINDTVTKLQHLFNQGTIPTADANFTMLFFQVQQIAKSGSAFLNISRATWRNIISEFRLQNVDLTHRQWEPVLDRLNENYVASALLAVTRGLGLAMDSGNLSPVIGRYIHMAQSISKYSYMSMAIYVEMYSKSSPIGQLVQIGTTYAPELLTAMFNMTKDTEQMKEIFSTPDFMAAVCDMVQRLPLPAQVPKADIVNIVCNDLPKVFTDFSIYQQESAQIIQQMSYMSMNPVGTVYNITSDWTHIMDYTERVIDMIQQPDNLLAIAEGPANFISMMNFTQIGTAMSMIGDLMKDFTYKDVSSLASVSLAFMNQLDASMQNVSIWKGIKHSVVAWNAYAKMMNSYYMEMSESGSIGDMIQNFYPPSLQSYINNMAAVTPDFINALKNAVLNPDKLVKKLLDSVTGSLAPDCSSHWVTDFLMVGSNSSLRNFEQLTCSINWTAVSMEMIENDPNMQAYTNQISLLTTLPWSDLPDVHLNWTEVMVNTENYLMYVTNPAAFNMTQQFSFAPFNVSAIDMKWTDFLQAVKSLQNMDMQKLTNLMTTIQMSLEKLGMGQMGNETGRLDSLIIGSLYGQLYMNHHFMQFANKVLTYMSTHNPVNLLDYLGSDELRKAVRVIEMSPELSQIGLDSIITYLMDPSKFSVFLNMQEFGMQLCTNVTLFEEVFDLSEATSDPATLQSAVCSSAAINYTAVYEQLRQHWDGFGELVQAIIDVSTDNLPPEAKKINISVQISDQTTFNELINRTIYNPPTIIITTNNDWMNASIYASQWENFMHQLNNTFVKYTDSSFMSAWQRSVTKLLSYASVSIPGFDQVLRYMDIILDMVEKQLKQSLESLPEAFRSYPNLSKILGLLEQLPEAFLVVSYTDLVHPEKVAKWSQAMTSWDTFCSADSTQLFETPPGVQFSMENFLREMCEINITNLAAEMAAYQGRDKLDALLMNPNTTEPVNVTAFAAKMASLIDTLTSFSTQPMGNGWDLRIFNESIWSNVINKLTEYANSSAYANLNNLQTTLTQTMMSYFQSIPGFNTVLSYMDVILDIITEQVQRSFESLPEAFRDYPNMYTILQLLDDLPSVLEVVAYTNFITPQKMSKWGTAMQTWEGFCRTDVTTLMTVPPGLSFDMSVFINTMCSINITALAKEAERYEGSDRIMALINSNMTEPVNATAVIAKLTNIVNMFTQNTSSLVVPQSQPSAFNGSVWQATFTRIVGYYNQSAANFGVASVFGMAQDLFSTIPGLSGQLGGLETVMAVMEMVLDRIIRLENETSIAPLDIFPDAPQLQSLMDLLKMPGVIPVLMESLNSQKMMPLFKKTNVTEVFMALCFPGANISIYLSVPQGIRIDIPKLQADFCAINVTLLEPEVNAAFDIQRITRVAQGDDHVNWLVIGNKFQRVFDLINRWIQSPPQLNLPPNWDNETYWLDMLNTYNMARQSPDAINAEIENLLVKMGPLLKEEPFRQYGMVMETVLRLLNENIIALQNKSMTVTTMFDKVPVLRDVITALGLQADVLEMLMTAPVRDPQQFTQALINPASDSYICDNPDMWRELLVLPPTFDTSTLTSAVCNSNTSAIIANLVRNLDLERLIAGISNASYTPDWQAIFRQSQELGQNINNLIMNPPTFKVNESLALLEQAYNQSNLWNLVVSYNVLAQAFGNSSEFQGVDAYMRGASVVLNYLNDILQKMMVNGVTLDLGSLFQGSPTFTRLVNTILHLSPDPITGLASLQLKASQNMAFATVAADPNQLAQVFCDETRFRQYFDVAAGFNLSSVLPVLCTMNFTQMVSELDSNFMVSALIAKMQHINSQPFDLQKYIAATQELNAKIMELVGVRNVVFGNTSLEEVFQVNTTALFQVVQQQQMALQKDYPGYIASVLTSLQQGMENNTAWSTIALSLKTFDWYLKYLNQNLKAISGKPLTLALLLNNTELGRVLLPLMSDPQWLDQLLQLQLKPDKLQELLQSPNASSTLCTSALWDAFVTPTNGTSALQYLQQQICSVNTSLLLWQSLVQSAQGYQFYQQFMVLTNEIATGNSVINLNTTELSMDITESVQLVTSFINSLMNSTLSVENFINIGGFQSVLNNLQGTLAQRLTELSNQLSNSMLGLIWPQIPDQNVANSMARVINTMNIFMTIINDRLESIKDGNLTLQTLSGNHPALLSLMEAYINVTKFGLQAWIDGEIHIERVIMLMSNQSAVTSRCQDGSVAVYISNSSTPNTVVMNLQTVICTYMTDLPNEFRNLVDYQKIQQQIVAIWNSTGSVTPQFSEYTAQINRFNLLLNHIAQSNIQVSNQLKNVFDFSSFLKSLNNLARDPSLIFQLLKPLGLFLDRNEVAKQTFSWLDSFMINPVIKFMETYTKYSTSFTSAMSDPGKMLQNLAAMTDYNSQMGLNVDVFSKQVFESVATDTSFIQNFLCNMSVAQNYFTPLVTPGIADMLCNDAPKTWTTKLADYGLENTEIYVISVKMLTARSEYAIQQSCYENCMTDGICFGGCTIVNPMTFMTGDVTWVQLLSDVEKLTKMFIDQTSGTMNATAATAVNNIAVLWNNMGGLIVQNMLQSAFGTLKILDLTDAMSTQWNGFKQMIHFVGSVNSYLNSWMERFTDSPTQIYLQDVFPNPERVAQLLAGVLGQETAAEFLTATFNPGTFYQRLSNPQSWQTMLCDFSQFNMTFTFPTGTNVAAVQQAMCNMARNQSSSLQQLLDLFEAGNILTELERLMSKTSNYPTSYSLWDNVYNTTMRLLTNLGRLQNVNVNGTSASQWFTPILSTLQALQNPTLDSARTEATCNELVMYIRDTEIFRQAQPFIVEAIGYMRLITAQLGLGEVAGDVVCALSRDLDLTKAVDLLKSSGFWDSLGRSNYLVNYNGSETLQCSTVIETSWDLWNAINNTIWGTNSVDDWKRMAECLKDGPKHFRTFLDGLDSILGIASELIPILKDQTLRQLLGNQESLAPVLDFILRVFTQQRTVLLKFSDLLKKNSTIEAYLLEALRLSPELVNSLLKSSINLDAINFLNQPVEEIRDTLCNATRLEQVLTLPNFTNVNVESLSRLLCTNMSMETAAALKSAAEATFILQQILSATETGLNQAFFNNISTHVFNLVGDLQSITEIASLFSGGFDLDALKGNIPQIDRFLMSSGPERIVRSLTDILEDIRKVLPPTSEANTVLKEIDLFIRGFVGLDIVQSYFLEALSVVDFIKNPTTVYNYLVNVVGMNPDNAKTVLEGVFSIRVFLNSSYLLDKDFTCTGMFGKIIILNTTDFTMNQISNDMCHVNESVAIRIANLLIPELTIGDLVKKYVSLSADDIFQSVNLTTEEATDIATKLSNAQNDLLRASDILTGKSTTLNLKSNELLGQLFNLPQAQTGPNTMGSIQPLLCGNKPGGVAYDVFNVGSVLGDGSSKATADKDREELAKADNANNGGDFCQKLYESIKSEPLGSIIWAYLKPILRGKIVYTPNTALSRRIIEQADSVFGTMQEVQRVARIWSQGAPKLMRMSARVKDMGNLKDVLKNEFISSLLKATAGLDAKELLSGLDALDAGNFNSTSIKGMKVAADLVVNYTSCMEMDRFVAVETEEALEKAGFKLAETNNFLAGIVFTNLPKENQRRKRDAHTLEMPKHIQYKIRMQSENVKTTSRLKARYWQPNPYASFAGDLQYLRGFVQLQDMIERAIVAVQTGDNTTLPGVYLKQFPFPCHTNDVYIGVLGAYLLPVVMTFAWLAALAIATRNLVYDREQGHEQTMKIMGMKAFYNWFAWLISTLILMVIVSGLLTIIIKVSHLFNMSNPTIVFLYLVCFCVSTTMLCYLVSAFFTRVTLAILMVLIVYFLSYLPYVILISLEVSMTFWQKSLACLFSTSAFGFAAQYLARLEVQNVGLQWNNIATSPIVNDPMTFSWACYMMLIDSAIYLILGWYIRTVKPGKYGIAQPFYFPLLPSYWCGKSHGKSEGIEARRSQNVTLFEPSGSGIPGMAVRGLTKRFGNKTVVDNISIDFFEGQVTALLGHNGASKTTTMNMLIGLLAPTSGELFINKKDNAGTIGYCPQHNTLLDYMTVMEHMELYSGIKCDWSASDKANEIRRLLNDVDLYHVRDVRVNQLSGGMKRRLCVALAFVGGSTAVVLDEPTSGVDPHARKYIWNLIVKQRIGRTILLSTHHLDEADTLGDTVAIMHNGHVLCSGSPIFLKEKLGGGYHLTADKAIKQEADGGYNGNQSHCNSHEVQAFIQTMLPQAQLVEEVGTEMIFNLPRSDSARTPFSTFFKELDRNLPRLHINSYGVSDTTLEDVFLKVTALADDNIPLSEDVLEKERMKPSRNRNLTDAESDTTSESSSQETSVNMMDTSRNRYSGLSLKLQQMSALFLKRFHHYRRNWRMFVSIVLLPTILFVASMGFAKIRPAVDDMPSLLLTPDLYSPNIYMFYKDMSYESLSDRMANTLVQKPGVGTACMDGFKPDLPLTCDWTKHNFTHRVGPTNDNGGCVCKEHKQECTPGSVSIPRYIETPTGNYLQDLLGLNIPSYLLNSFEQFIEKRYGGWSYEVGPEGTDTEMATTVWYNNRGFHSMPAFFNAYSNSVLRAKMGQTATKNASQYGISVYSHPFTFQQSELSLNSLGTQAADAGIALVFLLAFTFIPSAFMVFLVNENINKEKQLQFISGVGSALYWTTTFLWDMIVYCFTVAIAVAVLAIFKIGPYWDRMNLAGLVVLIILYGWAILPMMYMTLKLFKSASSAYLILFCLNMLIGILSIISIISLVIFETLGLDGVTTAYNICKRLFLIFPQFCLGQGLIDIATNHFKYVLFIRFGEDVYEDPFSLELLGWNLVALAIEGFVFFVITIFIESRHGRSTKIPRRLLDIPDEDDDVRNERNRIQMGHTKDDILYINGLTKMYRRGLRKFLAVDNISFGVSKGECFGLLGVNGAGKTTTFRILTGDTNPSSGDAFLNGHKISTGDPYLGQEVGYCPQEGGLDEYLSGEELLFCHARLKGMSDEQAKKVVTDLVAKLRLAEYAQKAIKTYSGGTKRKLSLAIAMLGEPQVLFLDEPTTGMDPATRRLVWKCITKAGQHGQSIVLTSHSMDECDALCSRLAIMVNGRLMCLGNGQHLKSKFGEGYTVTMHIQGLSTNRYNIEQAFLSRFPGAAVKDQHTSVLEVSIPRGATSVAELFNILQTAQAKNHISRYSLSQTTLDTVFVNFARNQSDSVSEKDDVSTSGSASEQSGMLAGPFANQTYAYMNPQYLADPEDVRLSTPSQYAANLARASTSLTSSFKGDKHKEAMQMTGGNTNEAFSDDEKVFSTRL